MKLHIVLYEPAIIHNVGNIARTCQAFNATLHLIRPYGFIFDKNKLKRSSTNHFDNISFYEYNNWDNFIQSVPSKHFIYLFTRFGNLTPNQMNLDIVDNEDIYLVFGNEHYGINKTIINNYLQSTVRIPMVENMVCINVANAVAIGCYEVYRQLEYINLYKKGK